MEGAASEASQRLIDGVLSGDTNALLILLLVGIPLWILTIDKGWFHYSRKKQGIPSESSMFKGASEINRALHALDKTANKQTEILGEMSKLLSNSTDALTRNTPKLDERNTNVKINGDRIVQAMARTRG